MNPFVQYGLFDNFSLKRYRLVRKLYLHERMEIEEATCAICSLTREITYTGSYDRETDVEAFNVCKECGRELIEESEKAIGEIRV